MNKIMIPDIDLKEYDYILPKDRIAFHPLDERDSSKLLVADATTGNIEHRVFNQLKELIIPKALLILNETKVIGARLKFAKKTGGLVELLLVEPLAPSTIPAVVLQSGNECTWMCIIGGRKVNEGSELHSVSGKILRANVLERESNKGIVKFSWSGNLTFSEILTEIGETPLPPYIDREADKKDIERYQTVFASDDGSVAAPTAGLHFTDSLLTNILKRGVDTAKITLHVGPGTFQPVDGYDIVNHNMHYEQVYISKDSVEKILVSLKSNERIISVGTTCCRTVESLYWYGLKLMKNEKANFDVKQWEPYEVEHTISPESVFIFLHKYMEENSIRTLSGKTSLIIVPGYKFKVINALITNFHLPKSTLILLVAAFTGKELWRKIYNSALEKDYRFLSYGDSTYLIKSIT